MNRSLSADLVKAVSIIGVVFIHGATLLGCESEYIEYVSNLFRFCVPCFIIIWAYFFEMSYEKKDEENRRKYLKERFIHNFRIYLIWSLFYLFILADWNSITFAKLITRHFTGFGWSGQYFFIILFQLIVLYPVIRYCYNNRYIKYSVTVLVFIIYFYYEFFFSHIPVVILKFGAQPFVFWVPYVFIGISMARNELRKISLLWIMLLFAIPVEFYLLKKRGLSHDAYITFTVLVTSSLTCSAMMQYYLAYKERKFYAAASFIGRNTMTIFVANPMIIVLFHKIVLVKVFSCDSWLNSAFSVLLSVVLILIACLFLVKVINKLKLSQILN